MANQNKAARQVRVESFITPRASPDWPMLIQSLGMTLQMRQLTVHQATAG